MTASYSLSTSGSPCNRCSKLINRRRLISKLSCRIPCCSFHGRFTWYRPSLNAMVLSNSSCTDLSCFSMPSDSKSQKAFRSLSIPWLWDWVGDVAHLRTCVVTRFVAGWGTVMRSSSIGPERTHRVLIAVDPLPPFLTSPVTRS